jgi:hypothetical protein
VEPGYARFVAGEGTKYDDATWHSGGEFPSDLPDEAGGTHIAMFVAWALLSELGGELHLSELDGGIKGLRDHTVTPGEFLFESCDGKFTDEDLNELGNAFAVAYFQRKTRGYVFDYEKTLRGKLPSTYHVPDSWKTYDKLSPVLDRRFGEWCARTGCTPPRTRRKPWWRFW